MLLIDAHLDLAMNALNWDRDLTQDVHEVRKREAGMAQKGRGRGTTTFPEMRKGNVGISLATVIARTARPNSPSTGSATQEISYAKAQGQLAYYRVLEAQGVVRMITDRAGLEDQFSAWASDSTTTPLGFILSMEGADPIVDPEQMVLWWEDGLRVVSLSHYGVSAYAHGTETEGGLTDIGPALLNEMDRLGAILDLTHLADQAFFEAAEAFQGPVLASHNMCRSLCPGGRQFTDDQVRVIIERGGVIGMALDAWMLYPNWIKGETQPEVVSLEAVVDNIAHISELAGSTDHVGIGSDLDGGYGTEQTPHDLDTIADLQKITGLMLARGFSDKDVEKVMHGNWMRFFREHLG